MSSEAMAWVWNLRGISASERNVLLRLAEHSDHRGVCPPEGYEAIADFCEVSVRQVMRIVTGFESRGVLSIDRRRGKDARQLPNVIRLHVLTTVSGAASALSRVTSTTPGDVHKPGDMPRDIPGDMGVTRLAPVLGGKGGDSRDTVRNHDVVTSCKNLNTIPLDLQPSDNGDPLGTWFDSVFWKRYPRKTAKSRARRAISRMKPNGAVQSAIMRAVDCLVDELRRNRTAPQFIPYASTWLADEPWLDLGSPPSPDGERSCGCGCGAVGVVHAHGKWWTRQHDPDVSRETRRSA